MLLSGQSNSEPLEWLAEGDAITKTGSVWVTWSTGITTLVNNTAQVAQPANRYVDDYPQPPKYQFELQTPDPASVASQVLALGD